MTLIRKTLLGMAIVLATTNLTAITAHADDPPLHHVRYAVSAANPIYADIYYLDQEPPIFSDYSHNPYQFVPNIQADIAPGKPWTYELDLANPDVVGYGLRQHRDRTGHPAVSLRSRRGRESRRIQGRSQGRALLDT